jgi:hypothetical protein
LTMARAMRLTQSRTSCPAFAPGPLSTLVRQLLDIHSQRESGVDSTDIRHFQSKDRPSILELLVTGGRGSSARTKRFIERRESLLSEGTYGASASDLRCCAAIK